MKMMAMALTTAILALPGFAIQEIGESVPKITFADRIDGWSVLDNQTIVLRKSQAHNYVVQLRAPCHNLKYAYNVGVSSSNNVVYAKFDYVSAGNFRCSIDSIKKVTKAELALLRS